MRLAFSLAFDKAGSNKAARMAIMAMTTSNSIRVKPHSPLFFIRFKAGSLSPFKLKPDASCASPVINVLFMRIQFLIHLLPPYFMAAANQGVLFKIFY
jgi:hypothetical protein